MHTLFNVATTLLLLPLGTWLAKLAVRILPEHVSEDAALQKLLYIKPVEASPEYQMGNSAIAINGVWRELGRMADMARGNVEQSFLAVLDGDSRRLAEVERTEEYIDYLNKEISKYISRIIVYEANERDSMTISAFFKISGNLERIGDHAVNICEYTKLLEEKRISFSEQARGEIAQMKEVSLRAIGLLQELDGVSVERLSEISAFEQKMDDMTLAFRQNQIWRMHEGVCSDEACILYSEMLTDFERIGDHILNIGQELASAGFPR